MIRRDGFAGRITLNRPRALNMLGEDMLSAIGSALSRWREDAEIRLVILDATGTRAFCAGGDIAAVHGRVVAGDIDGARAHCAREYALDATVAGYPKPVVALVDGVAMGGGIGLACHASHPVASERAAFAMPECAIGWIPDSGASLLLARMPGHIGDWLALTGEKIGHGDAIALGLARHFVASENLEPLVARLCREGETTALEELQGAPGSARLPGLQGAIDGAFAGACVPSILARLDSIGESPAPDDAWGPRTAAAIRKASPLALALALSAIGAARRHATLAAALSLELAIVSRLMSHADFAEGIRAAIIDRDRKPRWSHPHEHRFGAADLAPFLAALP